MSSDLDTLIDFYQWEIIRIKAAIDENMKMGLFKEVELDQQAISNLQQQLDILLELKNPIYPEIKESEYKIEMYEQLSNIDKYDHISEWKVLYSEQILAERKKLAELKKLKNLVSDETQFVDEAIFSLLKGAYNGFILHFNIPGEKAYIKVEHLDKLLFKVKIDGSQDILRWVAGNGSIKELGLNKNQEGVLSLSFQLFSEKNILPLKEELAKLVLVLRSNFKTLKTMHLEMC